MYPNSYQHRIIKVLYKNCHEALNISFYNQVQCKSLCNSVTLPPRRGSPSCCGTLEEEAAQSSDDTGFKFLSVEMGHQALVPISP